MSDRPLAWERSYPSGVSWDALLTPSTLPALLAQSVARHGNRTAIVYRDGEIGYHALAAAAERLAAAFVGAGFVGRSVALYLPNVPDHPVALFAAARAGARAVMLSPLDAERTLIHKLQDSESRTLVTTNYPGLLSMALKLLDAGALERVIVADDGAWGPGAPPLAPIPERPGVIPLAAFTAEAAPPAAWPDVAPEQIALLQYTGGTTGVPKGAILTHANLTVAIEMYDAWHVPQGTSIPGEERVICVLPLFHIYALTAVLLRHLRNGNQILLHPRFDPEHVLDCIERWRATALSGVPTMWIALAGVPGVERRDLASLRSITSGGAPMPVEVAQRCRRLFGRRLTGGWGMTETSPAGTHVPAGGLDRPGTIGLPLPGIEMQIVALDDPRRVLPPGETGEIRIRGPNVTQGYWNRPAETKAVFADGWFLTGDVGRMDADGFFFLVDRKKDMIISGGFNVYPQVIEHAIYEHPDIEEAIVIGVPDAYRGEAAKAYVKLRAGAPSLTLDALRDFLKDKLGRHELPAELELCGALPRTAVGKLSRLALKEEALRAAQASP